MSTKALHISMYHFNKYLHEMRESADGTTIKDSRRKISPCLTKYMFLNYSFTDLNKENSHPIFMSLEQIFRLVIRRWSGVK